MKNALLGALIMGAFIVLTSFALTRPSDPAKVPGGPAWTVSQYQLDRAFRIALPYSSTGGSITGQVPASGGFIITQVCNSFALISINGVSETVIANNTGPATTLNPPIVVRPGDTVTIAYGNSGSPVIAGYTTLPGET